MTQIDTTAEHEIGRDWARSLALPLICAICTVVFWYGIKITPESYYEHRFQTGAYIILPLIAPFGLYWLFRLIWPVGALIRITPEGFADRRVNRAMIPWSEITNVVRRGEFLSLTLSRKFLKTYRMSLSQKAIKASRKSARPSHLLVADGFVAQSGTTLKDIVMAYHQAYSNTKATATPSAAH